MDKVPLALSVLFIGEYFSLITTVVLEEAGRKAEESDEDYAVRLASGFLKAHYGWDVAAASNDIGVMSDQYDS